MLIRLIILGSWTLLTIWDADDVVLEMAEHSDIWIDGGEDFSFFGLEVAGAGVYWLASEVAFDFSVWGTAEKCGDARLERCRAFLLVPGFWGAIVALQGYWPCHFGVDNPHVA